MRTVGATISTRWPSWRTRATPIFSSTRSRHWALFPLDVRRTPVDFLAADGHKWMLGPEGAGLFYVRREHLNLLRPLGLGWNSVRQGNDYSASN